MIFAVALFYVFYYLVASVIAKINVKVGHTDALGIEKSLKKKIELYRINVGYTDKECNYTTRTRASAGTYGNSAGFCISYVIRDYEIIIGKAHLPDHLKLILGTLYILVSCMSIK